MDKNTQVWIVASSTDYQSWRNITCADWSGCCDALKTREAAIEVLKRIYVEGHADASPATLARIAEAGEFEDADGYVAVRESTAGRCGYDGRRRNVVERGAGYQFPQKRN